VDVESFFDEVYVGLGIVDHGYHVEVEAIEGKVLFVRDLEVGVDLLEETCVVGPKGGGEPWRLWMEVGGKHTLYIGL